MRMLILTMIFGLAAMVDTPANANPIAGNVEKMLNGKELEQSIATIMILSMSEGIMWSNVLNEKRGMDQHYCPPPQIGIVDDQYIDIFKRFMSENPDKHEIPLGLVMLLALKDVFPCQE